MTVGRSKQEGRREPMGGEEMKRLNGANMFTVLQYMSLSRLTLLAFPIGQCY